MLLERFKPILNFICGAALSCCFLSAAVRAETIDELKQKIEDRNKQIEQIQKEIDAYQVEIDKNSKQATSLKQQIARLEATKKKYLSEISLTEKQIESAEFEIDHLDIKIEVKNQEIEDKSFAIAEIIRNLNDLESASLVEMVLSQSSFSDFFSERQRLEDLQAQVKLHLNELQLLKGSLQNEKDTKEQERGNLEKLRIKLEDQKKLVEVNKNSTNKLLTETKNKESTYKKLLADRLKKQKALEEEISEFENQIKIIIDPSSLPAAGSGVLKWPVSVVKITQYFGNTPFATQNPQVYGGNGHNGVDFSASEGTPVRVSAGGVLRGVGDTDISCRGVSYGKWVLIDHENNLTTLYAHLSFIKVSPGQRVETGEIIGYSGDTGYSTGPHLHYGVFASKGVEIGEMKSKVCGTMMRLPLASRNSYLNPLSYL